MILFKYMWARFLRVGVVLDFENIAAYRDPVVLFILLEFILASLHFTFYFREDVQIAPAQAVTYFFSPAVAFLIVFYGQYDIEALLLPLNKYCEANPQQAHGLLSKLVFVKERRVANVSY